MSGGVGVNLRKQSKNHSCPRAPFSVVRGILKFTGWVKFPKHPSSHSPSKCVCAELLQSCPTLCNSMDCSPPGCSVHGILQARILEWVAMPSSRGPSQPRDRIYLSHVSCMGRQILCHWHHLGSPPLPYAYSVYLLLTTGHI